VADLLYKQSGLLGVSGISADMRDVLTSSLPEAAEAVELFCHRAAGELGRLAMIVGGLDAVVFTAGIGENAPAIRARICEKVQWLGVDLADRANQENQTTISGPQSRVGVFVIPTNEERMIARHCRALLGAS
jgi:acetate kinase